MKIFRYVSWDSNGVSADLLKRLYSQINDDLDSLSGRIADLAHRSDLSSQERTEMQELLAKWAVCKSHAKDTIDVGQTDAAMATMMLGQTDDTFRGRRRRYSKPVAVGLEHCKRTKLSALY